MDGRLRDAAATSRTCRRASPRTPALKQDDIAPFFRDFSQKFNGKTYMITLDGDFQMAYYRTDSSRARHAAAEDLGRLPRHRQGRFNGKDLNGDGKPDFGSCISKKRNAQAYWFIYRSLVGFLQAKGTAEGVFFDPPT